jgi:lipoprotein-anchoring transpeptidase ErfK/SrfK
MRPWAFLCLMGAVRMRNKDVVELFDLVAIGTEVLIQE